jgi:hypothetical protein
MNEPLEIWTGDLLDRKADARFLVDFLTTRIDERGKRGLTKSYVLNLDAKWGQGKTFFLQRLKRQLEGEGYISVYVNAWNDDHAGTPLISVMSAIDEALRPFLKAPKAKKLWKSAKENSLEIVASTGRGLAKQFLKKYLGGELQVLSHLISKDSSSSESGDEDAGETKEQQIASTVSDAVDKAAEKLISDKLEEFRATSRSIDQFKKQTTECLLEAGKKTTLPLFVLIDELDRCRPTYAIELLEQIKHLFEIDNVVFVAATDTAQLRHAVGTVYGQDFDSSRYLLRFFDRSYSFEDPDVSTFVRFLFHEYNIDQEKLTSPPSDDHVTFFAEAMQYYELSLRDAKQCFDLLRNVITTWPYKSRLNLAVLLPLIVAYQGNNVDEFERLARHKTINAPEEYQQRLTRDWQLKFHNSGFGPHHDAIESRPFMDVNEKLQVYMQMTLSTIGKEDVPPGGMERWVLSSLMREMQEEYAGGYPSNAKLKMDQYPRFVRSAGRLEQ